MVVTPLVLNENIFWENTPHAHKVFNNSVQELNIQNLHYLPQ